MLTMFSWGYWGWGNATSQLVEAIDAAENARGFQPPIFADIRLRRQGRAKGFVGEAFRDLVGCSRYRWIRDLGNAHIASGEGGIKIERPEASADLLDLAFKAAQENRRLLFYCACEFPWRDGERCCHRDTVTDLLLSDAMRREFPISVMEWPGGEPIDVEAPLDVDRKTLSAVMNGRKSISIDHQQLAQFAGLPWGSLLTLKSVQDGQTELVPVGPARYATSKDIGHWYLPVVLHPERGKQRASLHEDVSRWRGQCGLHEHKATGN